MPFKITLFFVSLLSIFQVWHKSTITTILTKPILQPADYRIFTAEFKSFVLWIGFLLLVLCFLSANKADEKPSAKSSAFWAGSFVLVLGLCATLILTVNPQGRFPWNQRSSYINIAAHSIKPDLYIKQSSTPELLILGSSVSFTVPTGYFEKRWGINAFNMSLTGGGPIDFVKMLNYVIQKSPDGKMPSTLLVEMLSPSIRSGNPNETPLKIIPYMPIDQAALAFGNTLDHIVLNSAVSDSIFTLLFVDTHRWKLWVTFANNGDGIITSKRNKTPTEYQAAVKNDLPMGKSLLACKNGQLNPVGKENLEKLIELSRIHQISIVFYRPPINADLYTTSNTNLKNYARCKNMFNAYMKTLTKQNPNISYRDLSDGTKISTQGSKIYLDTHHLNTYGNRLVMQALNKEIESALAWAKANHK